MEEVKEKRNTIYWIDPKADRWGNLVDMTCIIDGYRWKIDKNLHPFCAGEIKVSDNPQNIADSPSDAKKGVTKIADKENSIDKSIENEKEIIMLQPKRRPGRPLKEGEVTRMTKWRREKALEDTQRNNDDLRLILKG